MSHAPLIRLIQLTGAAILVAACAGTERQVDEVAERTTAPGGDCFTVSLARDFRYLDDHNLIVYAAGRNPYHVELSQACFGLGSDFAIGLRSRTDRMCGLAGDAVIGRGLGRPERCSVVSVRRLDEAQMQALVEQFDAEDREDSPIDVEVAELPEEELDDAAEAESADDSAAEGADPEQAD